MNIFAGQEYRLRNREQTCGHIGGRRGWGKWAGKQCRIYTSMCEIDSYWEAAV